MRVAVGLDVGSAAITLKLAPVEARRTLVSSGPMCSSAFNLPLPSAQPCTANLPARRFYSSEIPVLIIMHWAETGIIDLPLSSAFYE